MEESIRALNVESYPQFDLTSFTSLDLEVQKSMLSFGKEMIKRGDYILPFPKAWCVITDDTAVLLSECEDGFGGFIYAMPLGEYGDIFLPCGTLKVVFGDEKFQMAYFEHDGSVSKQGRELLQEAVSWVTAAIMMLMSPGTDVEVTPASPKLNKARKSRGKIPIGDTYKVKIYDAKLSKDDEEEEESEGPKGTHASPRMHYRRGHYRRLGDSVIPVMHCLVGSNGVTPEIGKRMYEYVRRRIKERRL